MRPSVQLATIARRLLFDVPVHALTMHEAVEVCACAAAGNSTLLIGAVNAAKVVKMRADADLREAVLDCDLIIADGASLVWASRILRRPLPERVTGIDLFAKLLERAEQDGARVYFLGATQSVLDRMLQVLKGKFPHLQIVGARNGYFTAQEESSVVEDIRTRRVDYLFVGMGTPQKELFLARHATATGARVLHGVGGSFDVFSGVVKRAPPLWQTLGMEWLYRVCQEPRRMWKRYLITNTLFITWLLREWVNSLWSSSTRASAAEPPSRQRPK